MPLLSPPPEYCSAQPRLFYELQRQASIQPAIALNCRDLLRNAAQKDHVLRLAFLAAARSDRKLAAAQISAVLDRPWLGDVPFFDAVALTELLDPDPAEQLLTASSLANPSLALREIDKYLGLPYGPRVFEKVSLAIPGEAVGIASAPSRTAQLILQAWQSPAVKPLRDLATNSKLDLPTRQRAANLLGVPDALKFCDSNVAYFQALASRDRTHALTYFAKTYVREIRQEGVAAKKRELAAFPPKLLVLLVAYGREELDKDTLGPLYDQVLEAKLAKQPPWASVSNQELRFFLNAASPRIDSILKHSARPLLTRALTALEAAQKPFAETIAAAEIVDRLSSPQHLAIAAETIESEFARLHGHQDQVLYGLLAVRASDQLPARASLSAIAKPFRAYLKAPNSFDSTSLGSHSVQRHFFYDDDDGVESFDSFLAAYRDSPHWKLTAHDTYVHIQGSGARSIDIFANVPIDLTKPANRDRIEEAAQRQASLTRLLHDRNVQPNVIVHRGHAYHVEKTIANIPAGTRLIYLGSCRGMEQIDAVIQKSWSAQLIATSGIGTHKINDPLLKALNDELLQSKPSLDWRRFWQAQQSRLGANPEFVEYVPPYRNTPAILLNAYYAWLADGS